MTEMKPKPEGVDLPDGKQWEDLAPSMRYYYRNREEEKERIANRKAKLRQWVADYKHERGCSNCDEEHPAALDFHHHNDDKSESVAKLANDGYSKEAIKEEMEKCIILCANCHRKEHSNLEY
ncbi:HNH endonuclease [Halogranum tailed virus 1]|uniref:HNH endonuclease n=1 Tax=Halogranum tailed virus 1 TaxID=1273749 RepID=R4TL67_9CAUD|nr:HNH endonuclease [Halogranum tailed virus 1]AGM11402.1 hypothetical protein HGTV1_102 [Halogranum tailed virus 1]